MLSSQTIVDEVNCLVEDWYEVLAQLKSHLRQAQACMKVYDDY